MKILFSPGYGAGWTTWHSSGSRQELKYMFTYAPFIKALEKGKKITDKRIQEFEEDFEKKFKKDPPYTGGAHQLKFMEVDGPFLIEEYDGSERVLEVDQHDKVFYPEEF